ncbi:fasciclin domain-containing protein [Amycolatopsis sp. NPDC004169]|uniref:fasciclin domain-containing protein n=1 Tax=Amycolatopsis sp. NPDC004169 TaxID=3154453 RepID=UPI00339FDB38
MTKVRFTGIGLAAAALTLSACGNGAGSGSAGPGRPIAAPSPSIAGATGTPDGVTTRADVFGPACPQLPPGSLDSMSSQPAATAVSGNSLLTELTAAIAAANLADTLNSPHGITVFAPADPAFDTLGEAESTELARTLRYHVIGRRYDAKGLSTAGTATTLDTAGGPLKIEGFGETMTINGAKILCGNIPTENATVFVIDKLLTPGSAK